MSERQTVDTYVEGPEDVESSGTRRRDRVSKRRWYGHYGVREYWLIDPLDQSVTVLTFAESGHVARTRFRGEASISSSVLPGLSDSAADFFDDRA